MPGEATVTPLAPRLGAVSAGGMGGASPVGGSAPLGGGPAGGSGPGGGRFRAERPAVSERPAAPERPAMSHPPAASPALPRPAHRDPLPERPPVASGTASDDSERSRPAPQRPLVFEEEPDAAALDVQPALEPEPVATTPAPEPAAAANTEPAAEESPAPSRPGKKNPRGRRSSVPSWDEIMLGSSRQQD
jgi:hypothetical protein